MINTKELRIGNWIYSNIRNKPIQIAGLFNNGDIDITLLIDSINRREECKDFEPLFITETLIQHLESKSILIRDNNIFYFGGKRPTYFLVFNRSDSNYLIGMIDIELPEGYRRITKPFTEFHKLQNSYFMIYDQELEVSSVLSFLCS